MEVQIKADVQEQIQKLTRIQLQQRDYSFFVDWLVVIGIGTVKLALERHPELTLGDLVMMQFRENSH
jgi:hypothetical protein